MAASDVILCGICDAQHVSHVADYWCPECDEGLCTPCKKYHAVSKASKQHGIISINDYKKLPAEICKFEQNCTEHERKFQMFCPRHDKLCCLICISENHKECTGMFPIDEAIKSSKSSALFDSLEKSLKDIQENIEMVVKDREANLVKIKQEHLKYLTDIKDTRRKINSRLDELEKHIIDNLNSTETQLKVKIETLLNKLSDKLKMIEVLKTNLAVVKQHGSGLQAFIGSKMIERDVTVELNYIQNISHEEAFSQLRLKYQKDDTIRGILTKVISFGSVKTESTPSSVAIGLDQDKEAQMSTLILRTKLFDNITASLCLQLEVPAGKDILCITGASVFPDGRIIFTDSHYNKRLFIVRNNGTAETEIPLSPLRPFDVTCINEKTVAVTMREQRILIVDTETKQITNTIKTGNCRGITYRQGYMIYSEKTKGIVAIKLSNNEVFTLVNDTTLQSDYIYITNSKENIYYIDNDENVKCYSVRGGKRWEYKDESILSGATGIAVDQHGIVYVISNKNKCVVLISADGKTGRTLLTAKDGIKESYGIYFYLNKLNVVGYDGVIRQFEIA